MLNQNPGKTWNMPKKLSKKVYLLCITLIFLFSFFKSYESFSYAEESNIIEANISGHILYIPKAYLKFEHTSIGKKDVLLQAWYPGADIVPGEIHDLWTKNKWHKNIRILISAHNNKNKLTNDYFINFNRFYEATEFVKNEHGLVHKTQPKDAVKDKRDIWYEMKGENIASFIRCSEKLTKNDVPQCTHYTWPNENFLIQTSYDKRFLAEWKLIDQNIKTMFTSFSSYEASDEFIRLKIKGTGNIKH